MKSRQLYLLMIILLMIFIGSCSNNGSSHTGPIGDPPNLVGIVVIEGVEYKMESGGFRWKAPNKDVLTDAASPNQIAEEFAAIEVTAGIDIKLDIEKRPNIKLHLWEEHAISEVDSFDKDHFVAPDEPGEYIYEATAIWANSTSVGGWTRGEVSYTFVIEVN